MKGFIRLPREILEHKVFENPFDFRMLLLFMTSATFKEELEHDGKVLKKGEWIRSYRKLQQDLKYTNGIVETIPSLWQIQQSVRRLTEYGFIHKSSTGSSTVFRLSDVLIEQVFGHNDDVSQVQGLSTEASKPEYKKYNAFNNNALKNYKEDVNITLSREHICPSFADVYHQNYGRMLTPIQIQDFIAYMEKDGVEEELLNFAFEVAIKVSSHINYVRAIINNWIASGIRTKKGAEQEYNRKRGNTNHGKDQYSDIDFGW